MKVCRQDAGGVPQCANRFIGTCCPQQIEKGSSKIGSACLCGALAPDEDAAGAELVATLGPDTSAGAADNAGLGRTCNHSALF